MKKFITTTILIFCSSFLLMAQTAEKPFNFTLIAGLQEISGDHGSSFFDFENTRILDNGYFGASISYYLTPSFDVMVMGTWGVMAQYKNDKRLFINDISTWGLNLKYKFRVKDESLVKPYVFLGTGIIYYDQNMIEGREWMLVSTGGGLNFRLSERFNLQYQIMWCIGTRDYHDHLIGGDYQDSYLLNNLGIGYNFALWNK